MDDKIVRRIVRRIPPKHWLPIAVVAAITIVVVFKFTTDAVISLSNANRYSVQAGDEEQAERSDPETAEPTDDAAAESTPNAEAAPVADKTEEKAPDVAQQPAERMVPESLVRLLVDNLNKKDEMWGKLLAKRDKQIAQLNRQVSGLQGQLNEQQQQLADIRSDQVQQAWAEVDRFHEQQAFGVHGRSNNFAIPEQNGVQAAPTIPATRQTNEEPEGDPFESSVTTTSRRVTTPRTSPRPGYINVNPTRRTVSSSSGPPAGSARQLIENQAKRRREAVEWTRGYYNRSGSSRVLGELEGGHR